MLRTRSPSLGVAGETVGGTQQLGEANRLSREKALYLRTKGAAWFSREEDVKGDIAVGELADFAVLTDDYFMVPEEQIPEILPAWSPISTFGGYGAPGADP